LIFILKSTFNCPICEYKKIKDGNFSVGDFVEKNWIENYFPSIGLSFKKILEQRIKKTLDGYILNNKEQLSLTEIKFLDYSKQELKYSNNKNKDEYLHREFPDKRLQREISKAKKQLKTIKFEGPKIIYFITQSREVDLQSLRNAVLGESYIKIDENGNIPCQGYSGLIDKNRNRFVDEFLTAIIVFCCNPYNKHELWLFENRKSEYTLPKQLIDNVYLSSHDIYKK